MLLITAMIEVLQVFTSLWTTEIHYYDNKVEVLSWGRLHKKRILDDLLRQSDR